MHVQEPAVDRLLTDPRFNSWGLPTYRLSRLALAFTALIALDVAINAFSIPTMIRWRATERMVHGLQSGVPSQFDLYAYNDLEAFWNMLGLLTLFGAASVFLVWLYRARRNVDGLGLALIMPQRFSADWAVIGWFVPLANLVVPRRVVRDIVYSGAVDLDGRRTLVTRLVLPWWLLWLASNVTAAVSWVRPITQDAAWWGTASSVTEIISGVLVAVLVIQVSVAQREADDLAL